MRNAFAFLLCIFLLKSDVFAESDSSSTNNGRIETVEIVSMPAWTPKSAQFNAIMGIAPFPFDELNTILSNSRYGGANEFSPLALNGSAFAGFGYQELFEKWRIILSLNFQPANRTRQGRINPETGMPQEAKVTFSSIGVEFGGGYSVFKNDVWTLYPYFHIMPQAGILTVEEGENDFHQNFDEIFNNSSEITNTYTMWNTPLMVGIGAEAAIDFSQYSMIPSSSGLPFSTTFIIGFRAGYSLGTLLSAKTVGASHPSFAADGVRISLNFGLSFPVQTYKAKIISEEK